MTRALRLIVLLFGMASTCALASEGSVQGSSIGALIQALLGLAVVLGLMFVFFWILRRFGPVNAGAQGVVKIVGGVMLGPRERLVVVEVEDTWVLVGVAAGHVSTLHTLAKPARTSAEAVPARPPFADKLADLLRRPRV